MAFAFPSPESVEGWLQAGGYVLLFALLFLCGLGLPLPEDIPLIAAGALCANGKMHIAVAAVVAWFGIIGGDCMLYSLGRKFGMGVTRLPYIGNHLTTQRIARVEKLFEKYGFLVIGVGRMVAGIRGAMVVAAGAIKFPFWAFIIADGFGAVISGGFFLFIGHWLGKNLDPKRLEHFKFWFLAGSIVAIGLLAIWIWRNQKRQHLEKEILNNVDIPHADATPADAAPADSSGKTTH